MLQSDVNIIHNAVNDAKSSVELKLLLFVISLFLPLFLIVALQGRFVLYIDYQRKATKERVTSRPSKIEPKKKKKKNVFTLGQGSDLMTSPPCPLTLTIGEALGFTSDDEKDEAQYELGRNLKSPNSSPNTQVTIGEALGLVGKSRAHSGKKWKVSLIGAISRISVMSRRDSMRNRLGETDRKESEGRSLISLMKEMDRAEERRKKMRLLGAGSEKKRDHWVCHVCRMRKKDAVLVPCGHAYCRVCSREIWINRRSCPVCKSQIVEVLDSF